MFSEIQAMVWSIELLYKLIFAGDKRDCQKPKPAVKRKKVLSEKPDWASCDLKASIYVFTYFELLFLANMIFSGTMNYMQGDCPIKYKCVL